MNRSSSAADFTLGRVAARQRGLFTREQALAVGLSARVVDRRVAAGAWIALRRGVYRSALTPASRHQRALATCVGRGAALALSHQSAGHMHGLLAPAPAVLDVVTSRERSGKGLRPLARVHHVDVDELDRRLVEGLPVTGPARTLTDLAACIARAALREAVDRAIFACTSVAGRARLLDELMRVAAGNRPGAPALRAACLPWRSDDHPRELASALEAEVLRLLLGSGLPAPECQHRVALPGGGVALLDFAWPSQRVALEVDGFRFHADRTAFDADRRRGNALAAGGWQVLRATAPQVRDRPGELVGTLAAALGRAAAHVAIDHRPGS